MIDESDRAEPLDQRIDAIVPRYRIGLAVLFLSFGAFVEVYELFQMTFLPAGLIRDGVFHAATTGHVSDQSLLGIATFVGLFTGELIFAPLADRFGRRPVFAASLLVYLAASAAMAVQHSATGVQLCRVVAGCGVGAQLITLAAYLSEIVPRDRRGRAFMWVYAIGYAAMPVLAGVSLLLLPHDYAGVAGWRLIVAIGVLAALAGLVVQSRLPESPRWLAARGRHVEADIAIAALAELEAQGASAQHTRTAAPKSPIDPAGPSTGPGGSVAGRTMLLVAFNIVLSFGFFGFSQWLPTILEARGMTLAHSLAYTVVIAFAYPVAPLLLLTVADRIERKTLIAAMSVLAIVAGLAFARASSGVAVMVFGVLETLAISGFAALAQGYQNEIVPTATRARIFGIAHAMGRASGAASSVIVADLLRGFGATAVLVAISGSWGLVTLLILGFGPRTNGRSIDSI